MLVSCCRDADMVLAGLQQVAFLPLCVFIYNYIIGYVCTGGTTAVSSNLCFYLLIMYMYVQVQWGTIIYLLGYKIIFQEVFRYPIFPKKVEIKTKIIGYQKTS